MASLNKEVSGRIIDVEVRGVAHDDFNDLLLEARNEEWGF